MIKALRWTMIIFGVIGILFGLSNIFIPEQGAKMYAFGEIPDYVRWMAGLAGASYLAAGIWVIAAAKDPIYHIYWVKFVITKSLLFAVVTGFAIIKGYVSFSQVGPMFILFIIFAIAFLAFYPWRRAQVGV